MLLLGFLFWSTFSVAWNNLLKHTTAQKKASPNLHNIGAISILSTDCNARKGIGAAKFISSFVSGQHPFVHIWASPERRIGENIISRGHQEAQKMGVLAQPPKILNGSEKGLAKPTQHFPVSVLSTDCNAKKGIGAAKFISSFVSGQFWNTVLFASCIMLQFYC